MLASKVIVFVPRPKAAPEFSTYEISRKFGTIIKNLLKNIILVSLSINRSNKPTVI